MLSYSYRRPFRFCLVLLSAAAIGIARPSGAQNGRKVVARYAATGTAQGYVFTDAQAKVPDDAQIKAFETALKGLKFAVNDDDTFDLQSGPGAFVFAFSPGPSRLGRAADGVLYLHFRAASATPIGSMDGLFYPAGADPEANPARITFSFTQAVSGGGTLTWHTIAGLKSVPVQ
jgi:hypothetical protein